MNRDYGKIANETRKKRLKFRAWHRGTREADLLIGSFADFVLADLDESGLDQFEQLLHCPDPDVYDWMTGKSAPPLEHDNQIMRQLKEFSFARSRASIDIP